jgi:membrane dipeptidase
MTVRTRVLVSALILIVLVAGALATRGLIERRYNRVRNRPPYPVPTATIELHRRLFVADLHADSLLWGRNLLSRSTTGHIDIPRMQEANVSVQVFSVVTTIPRNLNIERNAGSSDMVRYLSLAEHWPPRTWNSPKERALYQAAELRKFESESRGDLVILRTRSDLQELLDSKGGQRVGALLAVEGAQPLEGRVENLDQLYAAGFRMMSPTHFTDTEIGGSASGLQRAGLSDLGRKWVRSMEARNMLIDLAHASSATLHDVAAIAMKPVIVSHTGVKGTCNNNRNLSDDDLRAVAWTGGVVGIGYWETAVCGRDAAAIARAIQHAVRVIGVEHVGVGSDFDGSTTMPFDVTGLPLVTNALRDAHFSEQDVRLIMGGNVVRLLSQNLPER